MKKISFTLLIVFISLTFLLSFAMPESAGKLKNNISSMKVIYSYSVTKSFSERTHDTIELASVPSGKEETKDIHVQIVSKLEETPLNIKAVVRESLNRPEAYKSEAPLSGPEKGFSKRKYYLTKNYDKGRYTVIRTNKVTKAEKVYDGTYYEPSARDPFVQWTRDER
ncbi:hypothetical protein GW626_19545 [Peribacillus muralis]|uniref:hypothetical protein n=1 Tax=Peribacillus muralis TaxID=264697 RepID=UPI001F4E3D1F|nr:hypothetical protein [Peribacillus muralis]MCK1994803.1 hypothetical protein [Peribacillus muralis]MCK2015370.1 hypothetical protein [Peribacillus muralis]